jgi:hypothetical protein
MLSRRTPGDKAAAKKTANWRLTLVACVGIWYITALSAHPLRGCPAVVRPGGREAFFSGVGDMSVSIEDTRKQTLPTLKELIRTGTSRWTAKDWLRTIYEIRFFAEKVYDLLGQNIIKGASHLYAGQSGGHRRHCGHGAATSSARPTEATANAARSATSTANSEQTSPLERHDGRLWARRPATARPRRFDAYRRGRASEQPGRHRHRRATSPRPSAGAGREVQVTARRSFLLRTDLHQRPAPSTSP